jgi:hypothetical protein
VGVYAVSSPSKEAFGVRAKWSIFTVSQESNPDNFVTVKNVAWTVDWSGRCSTPARSAGQSEKRAPGAEINHYTLLQSNKVYGNSLIKE